MSIVDIPISELPDSDAFPAGTYTFRIDEVTGPHTDKNQVNYLSFKYVVSEGDHAGRIVREPYVPTTGKAKLKKILRAAGYSKPRLGDLNELFGLEFKAITKVKNDDNFGEQNVITAYLIGSEVPA